ncbi:sensor domain-containing diguanylate cyclase [Shewanella aegiceratis]|uniref:sensor domain-containing diguanylate cyclase n=1 Tax=Shewanella aegiceratis TaxID=2864203 RepID=UPI001C65A409|nr:sensor domain-containing diguanylate cyclase [Shewanella aegiceratis]QYJ84021.1 sensor domain-containing diguanylate cyclase [Shewanella aegiceratis]
MHHPFKPFKIYSLAILYVVFLVGAFSILMASIDQSQRDWKRYTYEALEKTAYFNDAMVALGYGGFIHDFKNAVIRQDLSYLRRAETEIELGLDSLQKYQQRAPEHTAEVRAIQSVVSQYRHNLPKLRQMLEEKQSVADIDRVVRVDDTPAIEAIEAILSSHAQSPNSLFEQAGSAHQRVNHMLLVILCALVLVSILVFSFIRYVNKRLAIKLKDLEVIFRCAPNAIFSVNEHGTIISANRETMRLFGFSERALNKINVDDLVPSATKEKHKKLRLEFQKSDRVQPMSQRNTIFYGKKLNGDVFPASISIATYGVGDEKHSIVVIKDLSDEMQYKSQANTDPLTKVANRRAINRQLAAAISRSNRQQTPLAVCIFDIDHFKAVNDKHGHLVGDDVLQRVAKIFSDAIRKTDFVGRWGGEEFVIILEDTDKEGAKHFADKLRQEVKRRSQGIDFPVAITLSAGVSVYCQDDKQDCLFNHADQALYRAKESGRDCVVVI